MTLLCLWEMREDVAASLSDSIKSTFGDDDDASMNLDVTGITNGPSKRRSRRITKVNLAIPPLPARVPLEE